MDFLKPIKVVSALIKKVTGSSVVQYILASRYLAVVGVLLVIGLIVLLVYRIRKRRKAAQEPVEPEADSSENLIASRALVQIWKTYIKKIPSEFRRAILLYPPFVVLGEAGCGKSSLIDACSDWKNQSNQFYPSHTDDPDLQIYQGARALIQEISPGILHDATNEARVALVKLWKAFYRQEDILAVVAVKSEDILADNRDPLLAQAQVIRGKLNILSRLMGKAVTVHVAVTFMDQVPGFIQFARYARENRITTSVDYDPDMALSSVSSVLFTTNLTSYLVTEPSGDFLKVLAFFNQEPQLYAGIEAFVQELLKPDPLVPAPQVQKIFLTSAKTADADLSNPFKKPVRPKRFWQRHPYFKHQVAAALLLLCGTFYLGFSHSYETRFFRQLDMDLGRLEENLSLADDKIAAVNPLMEKANGIFSDRLLPFLYDF
jgi:type VI protein secretion system component VasK